MKEIEGQARDIPKSTVQVDPVLTRICVAVMVLVFARMLMLDLGIDRLTTVTWMTSASLVIAVTVGCLTSLAAIFIRYARETGISQRYEGSKRPAPQAASRLPLIVAIGFVVAWTTGSFMGVLAQHISGQVISVSATVKEVDSSSSARGSCRTNLNLLRDNEGSTMAFCLLLSSGEGSGPRDLKANENVVVRLRRTPLGDVVEFVSRVRPPNAIPLDAE